MESGNLQSKYVQYLFWYLFLSYIQLTCFIARFNWAMDHSETHWSIAASNLPFDFFKKKPLKEFLQLFNVNAMSLMNTTSRSGLATHTMWLFLQSQETIKNKYILKQSKISFTQDVWISPNCVAFMAVTAHLIDKNFVMRDLTLAVPQVQGNLKLSFSDSKTFHWLVADSLVSSC